MSQGLASPLELALPAGAELLLHHHLPRIQRPALPPPHRAPTSTGCCHGYTLVRLVIRLQHVDTFRAGVMGGRQVAEERLSIAFAGRRGGILSREEAHHFFSRGSSHGCIIGACTYSAFCPITMPAI
jgi:hypothetical protein